MSLIIGGGPYEPDVIIAIYPEMFFPFLKSHYQLVYMREDIRQEYEEHKREKVEKGKLPDDPITVIAFIDAYNFQSGSGYSGRGIALHMIVERHELESFCLKLKDEYAELKEKFKVDVKEREYKIWKPDDSSENEQ